MTIPSWQRHRQSIRSGPRETELANLGRYLEGCTPSQVGRRGAHRLRRGSPWPAHLGGNRHGHGDRTVVQHWDLRCGPSRRGRRVCDREGESTAGRLNRHVASEHHLRQRRLVISRGKRRLLGGQSRKSGWAGVGPRLRLHVQMPLGSLPPVPSSAPLCSVEGPWTPWLSRLAQMTLQISSLIHPQRDDPTS